MVRSGPRSRKHRDLSVRTGCERVRRGVVTIAVVDDAVDTRHGEFAGRVAGQWDAATGAQSSIPNGWQPHGTKVAGLALAGGIEVTGVAPTALLLGVRVSALSTRLGDPSEAAGIRWAAEHGADVICCAWGPQTLTAESGRLPDHTRDAIDWAVTHGRGGKGCVVVFSSGNDGSRHRAQRVRQSSGRHRRRRVQLPRKASRLQRMGRRTVVRGAEQRPRRSSRRHGDL